MTTTVQPYPVKITGQLDTRLSRWLWLLTCGLVSAGATVPHLDEVGGAVLASGVLLLSAGGIAIVVAVARRTIHHAPAI